MCASTVILLSALILHLLSSSKIRVSDQGKHNTSWQTDSFGDQGTRYSACPGLLPLMCYSVSLEKWPNPSLVSRNNTLDLERIINNKRQTSRNVWQELIHWAWVLNIPVFKKVFIPIIIVISVNESKPWFTSDNIILWSSHQKLW